MKDKDMKSLPLPYIDRKMQPQQIDTVLCIALLKHDRHISCRSQSVTFSFFYQSHSALMCLCSFSYFKNVPKTTRYTWELGGGFPSIWYIFRCVHLFITTNTHTHKKKSEKTQKHDLHVMLLRQPLFT